MRRSAWFLLVSLSAAGCQTSVPQAARTYCSAVALSESYLFVPVYPPQDGIKLNSLLELHLTRGWDTSFKECVPFTQRWQAPHVDTQTANAPLPAIDVEVSSDGSVDLGGSTTLRLPLSWLIAGGYEIAQYARVEFENVKRHRSITTPTSMIVDSPTGRTLDSNIYPLDDYLHRRGPDRRKKNSLWFLRVEEAYAAPTVHYAVAVKRDGRAAVGADLAQLARELTIKTGTDWSYEANSLIKSVAHEPPLIIGVQGTLYEVSSLDGRLLRSQQFPLVRP